MKKLQKSVSLLNLLKRSLITTSLLMLFIMSICLIATCFFILKTINNNEIIKKLDSTSQEQPTTPDTNPIKVWENQLNHLINHERIFYYKITDHNHTISTGHIDYPVSSFEYVINSIFYTQPITLEKRVGKKNINIELQSRAHNFIKYYQILGLAFLFGLFISLLMIAAYIFQIQKKIKANIHPVLETIHSFKQFDQWKKAPLTPIKEFQLFSLSFNALIEKFDSTNQNLKEQNQLLHHQAYHDALTRIPNRLYFREYLNKHLKQNLNQYLVLLYIDNNKFKAINDIYGHLAGDAVLIETAQRLKKNIPKDAFVARLGGDEFAVVITRVENLHQLEALCEKLIHSSYDPLTFNDQRIPFSFSVGASFAYHAKTLDELLHQADEAMYLAKKSERKWAIFNPQYFEDHLFLDHD